MKKKKEENEFESLNEEQQNYILERATSLGQDYLLVGLYAIMEDICIVEERVKELILDNEISRALSFLCNVKEKIKEEHKTNYNALLNIVLEYVKKDLRLE